jgi:hypothetical protein
MRRLLLCLAIAGCARAGKENSIVGGLIDAGPQQTTLTQTTSDAVALGASLLNCHNSSGFIFENSYYRVFTLADDGIATTLHVTQVEFGIDTATAGTGGKQPGTVRIGSYGGAPGTTLDLSLVRAINSVDIQIPDGSATTMTVPITADVAATASMIVELFIPDGHTAGNEFKVGANASGERKPGYLRSPNPTCDVPDPATLESLSPGDEIDLILTVTGTTDTPS